MEKRNRKSYPSDLTDKQWEEIEPLYTGMRNCTWGKRELTDAVLYLVDSGCKWRQLPHDFPPYSTVLRFIETVINRPKIRNLRTNAKDGKYSVFKVQSQVKLANSTDKK